MIRHATRAFAPLVRPPHGGACSSERSLPLRMASCRSSTSGGRLPRLASVGPSLDVRKGDGMRPTDLAVDLAVVRWLVRDALEAPLRSLLKSDWNEARRAPGIGRFSAGGSIGVGPMHLRESRASLRADEGGRAPGVDGGRCGGSSAKERSGREPRASLRADEGGRRPGVDGGRCGGPSAKERSGIGACVAAGWVVFVLSLCVGVVSWVGEFEREFEPGLSLGASRSLDGLRLRLRRDRPSFELSLELPRFSLASDF